jgi:hypothetical protein
VVEQLIEVVPWLLPVVLVAVSLKILSRLGGRIQRGLASLENDDSSEAPTATEQFSAGTEMPPIEPR